MKKKKKFKPKRPRISRDVLLHTVQIGPVIETRAIAFSARELLMGLYGVDATIYPFGVNKYQLRVYNGLELIERRYADFFVKQLSDLFTWPLRKKLALIKKGNHR